MQKNINFMNSSEQFEELVMERSAWINSSKDHRDMTIKMIARKMALANKNNPHIYNHVTSRLKNNIDTPEDYHKQIK